MAINQVNVVSAIGMVVMGDLIELVGWLELFADGTLERARLSYQVAIADRFHVFAATQT